MTGKENKEPTTGEMVAKAIQLTEDRIHEDIGHWLRTHQLLTLATQVENGSYRRQLHDRKTKI